MCYLAFPELVKDVFLNMDEKQGILRKILSIEWDMFISVNEGGEQADCQEDSVTFEGMRTAQFIAWSPEAAASYLEDLEKAQECGRNLVEEKYINMMKTTEPSRYSALLSRVTIPSDTVYSAASEISEILLQQACVLFENYPHVSGHGRPLYSALDYVNISIETYQFCELLTYSAKTLAELKKHVAKLEKDGVSLAKLILENTVRFYGYESLEIAEKTIRERNDELGIEISLGCRPCEEPTYE